MIQRTHGFSTLCNRTAAACAAVSTLLPGVSLAQVSGPGDVSVSIQLVQQGQSPFDPSLTPTWQVIHNQQEIFSQIFDQPWSQNDFVLHTSDPLHGDFTTTAKTTSAGEGFFLNAVFSSNVDFAGSDLPPELMDFVESYQFQMSVVFARLTGPRASGVPVALASFTGVVDGQTEQRIMLLSPVSEDDMYIIEDNRTRFYGRGTRACFGPTSSTDPLTMECFAQIDADSDAAYKKLQASQWIGIGADVAALGSCIGTLFNPGLAPVCYATVGAAATLEGCVLALHVSNSANYTAAVNCCCSAAACRAAGGTDCQSTQDCRPGTGRTCALVF